MSARLKASLGEMVELPFVPDKHFPSKVAELLEQLRSESERRGHSLLASLLVIARRGAVEVACHVHTQQRGHPPLVAPLGAAMDEAKDDLKAPQRPLEETRLLEAVEGLCKEMTNAANESSTSSIGSDEGLTDRRYVLLEKMPASRGDGAESVGSCFSVAMPEPATRRTMTAPDEAFLQRVTDILAKLKDETDRRGHPMLGSLLEMARTEAEDDWRTERASIERLQSFRAGATNALEAELDGLIDDLSADQSGRRQKLTARARIR